MKKHAFDLIGKSSVKVAGSSFACNDRLNLMVGLALGNVRVRYVLQMVSYGLDFG